MIRSFKQILERAQDRGRKKLAVPASQSRRVSQLLEESEKIGLIRPILIGEDRSDRSMDTLDEAVTTVKTGKADILFQGDAPMKDFISVMTAKKTGLAERESLSYVSLFELPSENKLIMLTDTLIQTFPDIKQKVRILENAIDFAGMLGIEEPKIAALSIVELVNFSVPSTMDAAVLAKMSERRQLRAVIDGPLDIDCASSKERSLRKGLTSPVAGQVDIYFLPDIEAGYSIAEVMVFLGKSTPAGALIGTRIPVVLNPRFETPASLLLNMALACIRCEE